MHNRMSGLTLSQVNNHANSILQADNYGILHSQYATHVFCTGWVPTSDSQISPSLMATSSADPRVQEGLRQILQLDQRLVQKSAEAAIVARETFPKAWLAADKRQAERDQKLLLASLERYSVLSEVTSQLLITGTTGNRQ